MSSANLLVVRNCGNSILFAIENELPMDVPSTERGFQLQLGHKVLFSVDATSRPREFGIRDVTEVRRYTADIVGS